MDLNHKTLTVNNGSNTVSPKYAFVSTAKVVRDLQLLGWEAVNYEEVRTKSQEDLGFQKHLIRFRRKENLEIVSGVVPEIIIINAHNGKKSFEILSGLFRFACANGLIVGTIEQQEKIIHKGVDEEYLHSVIQKLAVNKEETQEIIELAQEVIMKRPQQVQFAREALKIRYEAEASCRASLIPELLQIERKEDKEDNLWNTFNRCQEKLIMGSGKMKPITDIKKQVKINVQLWNKLKQGIKEYKPF